MKRSRRKFTAEFKAKVVLEAIKEQKSLSELAEQFELHPNLISIWKREFLDNAAKVFSKGDEIKNTIEEVEKEKEELTGYLSTLDYRPYPRYQNNFDKDCRPIFDGNVLFIFEGEADEKNSTISQLSFVDFIPDYFVIEEIKKKVNETYTHCWRNGFNWKKVNLKFVRKRIPCFDFVAHPKWF